MSSYTPAEVEAIVFAILEGCAFPAASLRVWCALQKEAGPDQIITWSRADLAEYAGVTPETVSRVLPELERIGALARLRWGATLRGGRGPLRLKLRAFWRETSSSK